jgi:hypothetical protein
MTSFEDFIFDPEAVDEIMPEVQAWHVDPVKDLEGDELLDFAIQMEQEAIREHQPNLALMTESLSGYCRINHNAHPAVSGAISYGVTIGKLVASRVYGVPAKPIIGKNPEAQEQQRLSVYHKDLESDTLASFYEADLLPIQMLLDALEVNTQEKTARLRELLDYQLSLERSSPELEAAATLGAVVCYAAITYERERTLEASLDKAWARQHSRYDQQLSYEEMMSLTPAGVRSEIEGLARARWYWPRLRKSSPPQTS